MTFARKQLGQAGEELAAQFLVRQGYQILARNLKTRYGEIDILALDHQTYVVVEVKTKTSLAFGQPVEMVNWHKQQKLRLLTQLVAAQYQATDYRIDIVAIDLSNYSQPNIEHFIAAI